MSVLSFVALDRAKAATPTPTLVAPAAGTVLDSRVEVRADGVTSPFAQATFAARVVGDRDWTVLGTDDAAPYRVFADIAALPGAAVGEEVELRVVAKDAAGGLGADGARLVLGAAPPAGPGVGQSPEWLVVHYARPAGDYDGWGLHVWGDVESPTDWAAPLPFAGETAFGRFAWVRLKPGARQVGLITHRGEEKDGGDRLVDPSATPQVWLEQGAAGQFGSEVAATGQAFVHVARGAPGTAVRANGQDYPLSGSDDFGSFAVVPTTVVPLDFTVVGGVSGRLTSGSAWVTGGGVFASRAAAENRAVIHYHRPGGDYADWTLYHWTGSLEPSPGWTRSRPPDGADGFGVVWSVPLAPGAAGLSNIIHRGDAKDPGPDQFLDVAGAGHEVWFVSGSVRSDGTASFVLPPSTGSAADVDLSRAEAAWVDRDTLVWDVPAVASDGYQVRYDPAGGIEVVDGQVRGGKVLRLAPSGVLGGDLAARFPHLAGKQTFTVRAADAPRVEEAVGAQQAAVHLDSSGALRHATGTKAA
ncbi:pullulanase-associated domain-containing protein [Actinokineospora sp. G85]|uniref:pullulanase-associated domain-containing protein n=1 Tax=Actinokineospora sp. G85 TaxID=3406626 RepID=UPI003C74BA11